MTGRKITAPVWGGPLDGHALTGLPPAYRVAVHRLPSVSDATADPVTDLAGSFVTYELTPWADGPFIGYRWVPSDIAERLRNGWAEP